MRAGHGAINYGAAESGGVQSTLSDACDAHFTGSNAVGGGRRVKPRFPLDDRDVGDEDHETPEYYH